MDRVKKAAIFIRCSDEEAERIRHAAKLERRSLSGFILNAVMSRIGQREKIQQEVENQQESPHRGSRKGGKSRGAGAG